MKQPLKKSNKPQELQKSWILKLISLFCLIVIVSASISIFNYLITLARLVHTVPSSDRQIKLKPMEALGPGTIPFSCPTPDGYRVPGWYCPGKTGAVIILLHGLGGTRTQLSNVAKRFLQEGWGVVLIDQRGHGEHPLGFTSFGRTEAFDVLGTIEWLRQRPDSEVDPSRIGLFGASMGAATAIQAAAMDDKVACVVADSTYASIMDQAVYDIRHNLTGVRIPSNLSRLAAHAFLFMERFIVPDAVKIPDPVVSIQKIKCPIFLIHGERDARIEPRNFEKLEKSARSANVDLTAWLIPGGGHCDYHSDPEFVFRVVNFYRMNLNRVE